MFIAHFGVALAAKPLASRVSLGTLAFAAQFLDLIWPVLLLLGIERAELRPGEVPPLAFVHYPISHSLLAVAGWAVILGGAHFAWRREWSSALVVGALVASHWILDAVVHVPDLPLLPAGGPRVGLGFWQWPALALFAEFALFGAGLALYARATRPTDATGRWGLAAFAALLSAIQVANAFGPPPPSIEAVAWTGHAQWLLVVWAAWIDRHRNLRRPAAAVATAAQRA